MKTYFNLKDFTKNESKTILTLGTFDGVHLGHNSILKKITSQAKQLQMESMVLTFFPHPRMVLQQNSDLKLLNTIEEKSLLLEEIGIEHLIIQPFDKEFSRLSAEDFVKEILVNQLNIGKIIIGYDHRFGRNRTATIDDLIQFGKEFNFEVEQISAEELNEVTISSTKIRTALENGEISLANSYLGYPYSLSGMVVEGKKIGRNLGFPTANLKVKEEYKLIPKIGVYIVTVKIDNRKFYGMMNIGYNPTVQTDQLNIEVHVFDYNNELYNQTITVSFLERIRDEIKFNSLEDLKLQLQKDKDYSLQFIALQNA